MPRRGRCRCGTVLVFETGPSGYKMRCSSCGAVVRLRTDSATESAGPRQRQRSGILAFRPPAPSDPEAPYPETPLVDPDQYNYEALQPGELPVVELVPLSDLEPPARSFWRRGWLLAGLVLAIFAVVVIVVLKT